MALTDKEILALTPRPKKYKVFDRDGLHLVVAPNGSKYWYLQYRFAGRAEEISFGTYPMVTLRLARERCFEARRQIAENTNPRLDRRATKADLKIEFADIAEEWVTMMSTPPKTKRVLLGSADSSHTPKPTKGYLDEATVRKHRWLLNTYLNPRLGSMPMSQITSQQLLLVLKQIEKQGKVETAHRARSLTSRIFCYAHATGRAPQGDITWALRHALAPKVVTHHASLTDPRAVGKLLLAIDQCSGRVETRYALRLAPLLMLRPFELRYGEWREIDFKKEEWRIPAERMKMKSPHIVPLAKQAINLLSELQEVTGNRQYLFPVYGRKGIVISENTMNNALERLGYNGSVMTVHGFRSMASTLLNEQQRWHPDAIERQLAHSPRDKIRATYNYAEHLPERRKMMQAWADYLGELRQSVSLGSAQEKSRVAA